MSDKPSNSNRGRFQLKYRGNTCLNCGHPLDISDRFCPNCSQANSTKKISIRDFFDEFFSNVISYDSRLFRTLSVMAFRPGFISREYIKGRRMHYSNPFRFMLSLAIIYIIMLGADDSFSSLDRYGQRENTIGFDPSDVINLTMDTSNPGREQALKVMDSINLEETIQNFRKQRDSLIFADPTAYFSNIRDSSAMQRISKKYEFFNTFLSRDSLYSFQEAVDKYQVPSRTENKLAYSIAGSTLKVSRQPGSFINSLIAKIPFATFFFLPVFALFISVAYIRKKYTYTDNLIFSFHNQSLLFILLIISFLVDLILGSSTAWVALTVFSVYLYLAMKRFYQQGTFKTILKYLFLNTIYFILAATAGVLFVLASALTY